MGKGYSYIRWTTQLYQYFAQQIIDKKKRRKRMFKKHGRKGKYVNKLENSIWSYFNKRLKERKGENIYKLKTPILSAFSLMSRMHCAPANNEGNFFFLTFNKYLLPTYIFSKIKSSSNNRLNFKEDKFIASLDMELLNSYYTVLHRCA